MGKLALWRSWSKLTPSLELGIAPVGPLDRRAALAGHNLKGREPAHRCGPDRERPSDRERPNFRENLARRSCLFAERDIPASVTYTGGSATAWASARRGKALQRTAGRRQMPSATLRD